MKIRRSLWLAFLLAALVGCFCASMTAGKYPVSLRQIPEVFSHLLFGTPASYEPAVETSVYRVRLPRLLACIFAGAGLSVSGAAYQGVFKNPMVSPDLLGASSGAAFGACCAILCSATLAVTHLISFAFGLGAVALTWLVSSAVSQKQNSTMTLVLTGMVVSALLNAGVSIIKMLADGNDKLGEITFWLMGSMTHTKPQTILFLIVPTLISLVPMMVYSYRLNLLTFGDEEARTMGINVRALRALFIFCATLATAASVATCGLVGWVGLVIPHFMRLLIGPDYHDLLPASAIGGGLFLMLVDNVSRLLFQVEVPIGVLTALLGAPFFLFLLARHRGESL